MNKTERMLKTASWLYCSRLVTRYLISNTDGRWDGWEKAQRHRDLCSFYVAMYLNIKDDFEVDTCSDEYRAVYKDKNAKENI